MIHLFSTFFLTNSFVWLLVINIKSIVLEKARTTTEPIDGTAQANKIERRDRVDFSRSSLERNFITPARALAVFLLKLSDLETLPKTKRRSPYEQEPPIVVYWRKDVESKALEVWGSRENLLRECLKREIERKQRHQSMRHIKLCIYIDFLLLSY